MLSRSSDTEPVLRIDTGLQGEVQEAEAAAAPPDPALHERQVSDLDAACRDSLSRIAGLQNEIRYVSISSGHAAEGTCWHVCTFHWPPSSRAVRTLQLSRVICTDLQEQQAELRERRSSTEGSAAAEMRRIRQTDPKLR